LKKSQKSVVLNDWSERVNKSPKMASLTVGSSNRMSKWKTVKENISNISWEHKHQPPPWMRVKESQSAALYNQPLNAKIHGKSSSFLKADGVEMNKEGKCLSPKSSSAKLDHNNTVGVSNKAEVQSMNAHPLHRTKTVETDDRKYSKISAKLAEGHISPPGVKREESASVTSESKLPKADRTQVSESANKINVRTSQNQTISLASPSTPDQARLDYFKNFCKSSSKQGEHQETSGEVCMSSSVKTSPGRLKVGSLGDVDCLFCLCSLESPVELVSCTSLTHSKHNTLAYLLIMFSLIELLGL
jgi:hypothetical protein